MTTLTPLPLASILEVDPAEIANRLGGLYDVIAGDLGDRIVLYGAGHLGRRTLARLREAGVAPLAIVDRDPLRWGETFDGLTILSPEAAVREWATSATFVVAVYNGTPVRETLEAQGCVAVAPCPTLYWKHPAAFLPFGGVCAPGDTLGRADELTRTYALLGDDASREAFLGQLAWRLTLDYPSLPKPSPAAETYFIPEIVPHEIETFVDCGAFDGDSVEAFFRWNPDGRAVAIEPDPANGAAFRARMTRIGRQARVDLYHVAAASANGTLSFEANGTAGSNLNERGGIDVVAERLDDLLVGERPTFLKMDVEGAELDALKGATQTIRTHRPVLALCLYHKPEDLWQIPLFVDSLGVDYQYLLRVHAEECWEVVLYAVPSERLRR